MKLSDLISQLKTISDDNGDLPVTFHTYFGVTDSPEINIFTPDPNDPDDANEVKHVWFDL